MKKCYLILISLAACLLLSAVAFAEGSLSASTAASKVEAHRGDEVTVVVSVKDTAGDLGGISLFYDKAALELKSYDWLLSGAETNFSTTQLKGVFAYETAQNISGEFFKCVFKVKEDAVFYNTQVAFTVKVGSATTEVKQSISIACAHDYSGWTPAEDNEHTHTRTCKICNAPQTVEHNWKVESEKAATCKEEGKKVYKCDDCGVSKEEVLPKTDKHTWDAGTVTNVASCMAEGEKEFHCTTCGAVKKEVIPKASHTYDNKCDTQCNVCSATRKITHKYQSAWSGDETGHWHECSICGHRKDEVAHTPGAAATETTAQHCTVCDFIIKEALGHTHTPSSEWSSDEAGHYHACAGCDTQLDKQEHTFDNACDGDCNICGYVRDTEHTYYENYMSSQQGHWHECRVCGYKLEMEKHTPNEEGMCTDCGFVVGNDEHVHTYQEGWQWDVTGHWQEGCVCGVDSAVEPHSWESPVVTKRPSDTQDGVQVYTCSVCGTQKTELIPAGTKIPTSIPWLIVIGVAGAVIIGVAVFAIVGVVKSKKTSGRFSQGQAEEKTEELIEE